MAKFNMLSNPLLQIARTASPASPNQRAQLAHQFATIMQKPNANKTMNLALRYRTAPQQLANLTRALAAEAKRQQQQAVAGGGTVMLTPATDLSGAAYRPVSANCFFADPVLSADVKFELFAPKKDIDVDYPVESFLAQSFSETNLYASATEAGGAASISLLPGEAAVVQTPGAAALVHAIEITLQQSTFQTPQGGATIRVRHYPREVVQYDTTFLLPGATDPAVAITPAYVEQSARVVVPADGVQRRIYVLLGRYLSTLGRMTASVAVCRRAAQKLAADDQVVLVDTPITIDFLNLAVGSGMQFIAQACTPGTPQYDRLLALLPNPFGQNG